MTMPRHHTLRMQADMWEVQPAEIVKPPKVSHQGKKRAALSQWPTSWERPRDRVSRGRASALPCLRPMKRRAVLFCAMDGASVGGGGVVLTLV